MDAEKATYTNIRPVRRTQSEYPLGKAAFLGFRESHLTSSISIGSAVLTWHHSFTSWIRDPVIINQQWNQTHILANHQSVWCTGKKKLQDFSWALQSKADTRRSDVSILIPSFITFPSVVTSFCLQLSGVLYCALLPFPVGLFPPPTAWDQLCEVTVSNLDGQKAAVPW